MRFLSYGHRNKKIAPEKGTIVTVVPPNLILDK